MAKYFRNPAGADGMLPTVQQTAELLPRPKDCLRDLFRSMRKRETGFRRYKNEEGRRPSLRPTADIMIPVRLDRSRQGHKAGAREARRLMRDYGVNGFQVPPYHAGFYPNDRSAYVLYEAIAEGGRHRASPHRPDRCPGSGMPGGMGICGSKYSNPMYVDDVAVDFPAMKIILPHPSFPWAGGGAVGRAAQAPTSISTCPAGRRNTSRRSWCSTPTPS